MKIASNDEEVQDLGDEFAQRFFDNLHADFSAGNRSALFKLIVLCAAYQAVIPEWAADEIINVHDSVDSGEMKDFNDAFGWIKSSIAHRKRQARLDKNKDAVLSKLQEYRSAGDGIGGGALSASDAFEVVAEELSVSRRDVEDIYAMYGSFLKQQPIRSATSMGSFGHAIVEMKHPRRKGRGTFKD